MATVIKQDKALESPQATWNKVRAALSSQHAVTQEAFEALRHDFSTQGGNRRLLFMSIISAADTLFYTLYRKNCEADPNLGNAMLHLLLYGWFVQKTPARPSSVPDVDAYFSVGPEWGSPNDALYSHLMVPLKGVGAKAWGIHPDGMSIGQWFENGSYTQASGLFVSCTSNAVRTADMPNEFNGVTGFLIVG